MNLSNQPADRPAYLDYADLPLHGIKVIEMCHMVMGPAAGLVLADLGAEVIKVEPIGGDRTRELKSNGIGYFPVFGRNKQSISVDLKHDEGRAIVRRLADEADILIENFRDGSLDQYGLDYSTLSKSNPGIIYVSLKGFLSGPYKHRTALDEVVQMMGGMAYVNGATGAPRRVAPSVNDILGGTFGVVGALAELNRRHRTGKGRHVRTGLFETNLLLVAQFIAQYELSGTPARPMGDARQPAWGVYDIFDTTDGRVFVAVVSDAQWRIFARDFLPSGWATDQRLLTSVQREAARPWLVPAVADVLKSWRTADLCTALETAGLSFAEIRQPQQLLKDRHLIEGGALLPTTLSDGSRLSTAALPLEFDGLKSGRRSDPPAIGSHSRPLLEALGYNTERIDALAHAGVIQTVEASTVGRST